MPTPLDPHISPLRFALVEMTDILIPVAQNQLQQTSRELRFGAVRLRVRATKFMFNFDQMFLFFVACTCLAVVAAGVLAILKKSQDPRINYAIMGFSLLSMWYLPGLYGHPLRPATLTLSNLKQVNYGLLMYSEDCDGVMIPAENWRPHLLPYMKNDRFTVAGFNKGTGFALNEFVAGKPLADFNVNMSASLISSAQPMESPVASKESEISSFDDNLFVGVTDGSAYQIRRYGSRIIREWKGGVPINFETVPNTVGDNWKFDLARRAQIYSQYWAPLQVLLVPFFALRHLYLYARSDSENKPRPLIWNYILLLTVVLFFPATQLFR